jgi:hypothetical protein
MNSVTRRDRAREVMMALTTKAHHLLKGAQQEAGYELEAIELITPLTHVCEGLEGGFISFDQHALMLSTILIDVCEKLIRFIAS